MKRISLKECINLKNSQFDVTQVNLAKLQHITSDDKSISAKQLFILLANAPALKYVHLIANHNTDFFDFDLSKVNLSALEQLTLIGQCILGQNFLTLLNKSPNLLELYLTECSIAFDRVDALYLPRLKILSLSDINIATTALAQLLKNAAGLQELSIFSRYNFNISNLLIELECNQTKLVNLKGLNLSSDISESARQKCLQNTSSFLKFNVPSSNRRSEFAPSGVMKNDSRNLTGYKIFKSCGISSDPHVSDYHLTLYQWRKEKLGFTDFEDDDLQLVEVNDVEIARSPRSACQSRYNYSKLEDSQCYHYGQIDLASLRRHKLYQLPALSPNDELKVLGTDTQADIYKIFRSNKTGYYYIQFNKLPETAYCQIGLIIYTPANEITRTITRSSSQLIPLLSSLRFAQDCSFTDESKSAYQKLMQYSIVERIYALRKFCMFEDAYGIEDPNLTKPHEIFNYLIEHQTGVCRHRAQLFVALACNLGIEAFLPANDIHMMVVVMHDNQRITLDLGGGSGGLIIRPSCETSEGKIRNQDIHSSGVPYQDRSLTSARHFHTWDTLPLSANNADGLINELVTTHSKHPRLLVVVDNSADIESLHNAAMTNNSCFFTKCLDDLKVSAKHFDTQESCHNTDSQVTQFLNFVKAQPQQIFTWFINWSDMQPHHTRYNTIIDDKNPRFEKILLPSNLRVIVICDAKTANEMSEDFYSRLPIISRVESLATSNQHAQETLEISINDEADNQVFFTDSFHWKKLLLGSYCLSERGITLQPGALINAAQKQQKILYLTNAPWEDEEFRYFITEVIHKKSFFFNGQWYELPRDFTFIFAKPSYNIERFIHVFDKNADFAATKILNLATYLKAIQLYRLTESGVTQILPGWLAAERNRTLRIVVTQSLTDAQWYKIIQTAAKNNIKLQIDVIHGVSIPTFLENHVNFILPLIRPTNIFVMVSQDLDVFHIIEKNADIIPITQDTRFERLFFHTYRTDTDWGFRGVETDLLRRLREGKTIILKGRFSVELVHRLESLFVEPSSLLINGEMIKISGRLFLLSDDAKPFSSIKFYQHEFNENLLWECLEKELSIPLDDLKSLYQELKLTPRASHFRNIPKSMAEQILWLAELKNQLRYIAGILPTLDKATTVDEVLTRLEKKPILFLVSETGAGKSYFVLNTLKKALKARGKCDKIFCGMSALKAWLETPGAILFPDETNLNPEAYEIFENLAKGILTIELDGQCYSVPPENKIICAGNPGYYQGRFHLTFFERYPCYLAFRGPELNEVLNPLLSVFSDEQQSILLNITHSYYQKALDAGLLITARNAQMIVLRAKALTNLNPQIPFEFLVRYAALYEIKSLVSQDKNLVKDFRASLKEEYLEYKEYKTKLHTLLKKPLKWQPAHQEDFILTDSREKIVLSILWFLQIRRMKQNFVAINSNEFGINGILLEGEAGVGKSQLLIAILTILRIPFRHITATDPNEMQTQIIEAFHAGAVTIFDELNTFPHEQLLNSLLSGTDLDGNPADNPGFCLFATQNPIYYHGRSASSKASSNRMITFHLDDYTKDEFKAILQQKYHFTEGNACELIDSYKSAKKLAVEQSLYPSPKARAVFHHANHIAMSRNRRPS